MIFEPRIFDANKSHKSVSIFSHKPKHKIKTEGFTRKQDIFFTGGFGKITLDKGDDASNGSTEADLSGTALSLSSNHQDNWGNYRIVAGANGEPGDVEADPVGLTYALTPSKGWELFVMARELDSDLAGAESVDLYALESRIKF